jgi:SAM-dependent methyltransferase
MDDEGARLSEVYGGYAARRGRRRAWDRTRAGNRALRAELVRHLLGVVSPRLEDGSPILDVGCGGGWWLRELAARGLPADRLHGVDLIPERVAAAARSLPGADVRLADARKLPYEDGAFGVVTLLTALSSMADQAAARASVRESVRALAPGGLLVAYEPALPSPGRRRLTVRPPELTAWCAPGARLTSVTRLTVAPPLARTLAGVSPKLYEPLAGIRPLLTHRLVVLRADRMP